MQKPIIEAEAFMKFFEETAGAKFVDISSAIFRKSELRTAIDEIVANIEGVKN